MNVPDSTLLPALGLQGPQALRGGGRQVELEQIRTSQREHCACFCHRSIGSLSLEGKSILQARLEGLGSFAGKPCKLVTLTLPSLPSPALQPDVWNPVRM